MTTIKVLRVFANKEGKYGNPVGIVVDTERKYSDSDRARISSSTGFSETVFINSLTDKSISIYNPEEEIAFAGHAVVGVVYFLEHELQKPVKQVLGKNGPIDSWSENGLTWVKTELRNTPPWWHERLSSPKEIESLKGPLNDNQEHVQLWAWIDETAGTIRSRTFAPGWGIPEDEANGSGCMRLAATLGRSIIVYHGRGSVIYARSTSPGWAEVGGNVVVSEDLVLT
jgi:predicted PhzF superfamily epimerase YddE/YHI9